MEQVPRSPTDLRTCILLAKDKGWLVAYFDVAFAGKRKPAGVLSPILNGCQFFYTGLRAPNPSAPATRGSFRPAPALVAPRDSTSLPGQRRAARPRRSRSLERNSWPRTLYNLGAKVAKTDLFPVGPRPSGAGHVRPLARRPRKMVPCRNTWQSVKSTAGGFADIAWRQQQFACWHASSKNSVTSIGFSPSFPS